MVKASEFMYGMIISIGLFAILFVFVGHVADNYGVTISSQDNETFNTFSDISAIQEYVNDTKASALTETGDKPSNFIEAGLDILGLWFERGIRTIKLLPNLLTLFETIVNAGLNSASGLLGIAYEPLRFIAISLMTVALIVGVFLSVLVKKDL